MCDARPAPLGPGVVQLAEGDERAIRELTADAKGRRGALAKLTRLVRDRIKLESRAAESFDKALGRTFDDAVAELFGSIDSLSPAERVALRNISDDTIAEFIDGAGLADMQADWAQMQLDLLDNANRAPTVGGLPPGRVSPTSPAVSALINAEQDNLWNDRVRQPAVSTIRRGFQAAADGRSAADLVPQLQKDLGVTRTQAATEARTQVAEFSRATTAAAGEDSGAEWFVYRGPDDAITRPFCDALVGKAMTVEQIAELNNAQTLTPPIFAGGGYNCRHSWLPVSDGFIERNGIDRGTMSDVRHANAEARRSR